VTFSKNRHIKNVVIYMIFCKTKKNTKR